MKVAFLQLPVDLGFGGPEWHHLYNVLATDRPNILVTNEMPFGPWVASGEAFDVSAAKLTSDVHELGLRALMDLPVPIVFSSRPRLFNASLVNEAFALDHGRYVYLHQKQYFPQEPGFYEKTWFHSTQSGFETTNIGGLNIGVLLCTELMFNEHARAYGREGADIIVAPRSTGMTSSRWLTAGAMAAIVSGAYVVSSNRSGVDCSGQAFGGCGFAFNPLGELIASTSSENPVLTFELDIGLSRFQKREYPCYVDEMAPNPHLL